MKKNKKDEIIGKTEMREIRKMETIEMEVSGEKNHLWTLSQKENCIKQIISRERTKEAPLGGHYHKGEDPSKDPEVFGLIKGKMKVTLHNQKGDSEEFVLEEGYELRIQPFVHHDFDVIEDIVLLECRISLFNIKNQDIYHWPDDLSS